LEIADAFKVFSLELYKAVRQGVHATTQPREVLLQRMSPASISRKDEEVMMGRTKHGLPPEAKASVNSIGNIVFVLNAIDAGRLDHLFVDAASALTNQSSRSQTRAEGGLRVGRAFH
jgi:hypothetical protein